MNASKFQQIPHLSLSVIDAIFLHSSCLCTLPCFPHIFQTLMQNIPLLNTIPPPPSPLPPPIFCLLLLLFSDLVFGSYSCRPDSMLDYPVDYPCMCTVCVNFLPRFMLQSNASGKLRFIRPVQVPSSIDCLLHVLLNLEAVIQQDVPSLHLSLAEI